MSALLACRFPFRLDLLAGETDLVLLTLKVLPVTDQVLTIGLELVALLIKLATFVAQRPVDRLRLGLVVTEGVNLAFDRPATSDHVCLEIILIALKFLAPCEHLAVLPLHVTVRGVGP